MIDIGALLNGLPEGTALLAGAILASIGVPDARTAWRAGPRAGGVARARGTTAADGRQVMREGRAVAIGQPRPATLSGRPVVWDHWTVERRGRSRQSRWQIEEEGAGTAPFLLETEAGPVLVLPAGAHALALPTRNWTSDEPRPARGPPSPAGFLPGPLRAPYRYTEEAAAPGQPLFVLGRASAAQPEDPPGTIGRLGAGGAAFVIGGEPPARAARREMRATLIAGGSSALFFGLAVMVLILGA